MAIPWAILGQLALQSGQAYLENKAQRADQRALNRAMDRQRARQQEETNFSNLVNAFGGRSTPMQVPLSYRGSDRANTLRSLGQIAGLGSQAIGMYQGLSQAERAAQAQDLQNQNLRDQIDIRRGTLEASGIPLSAGKAAGPIAVGGGAMGPVGPSGAGSRTAGATLRMGDYQAPPSLSQIGQAAFNAQLADRRQALNLSKQASEQQDIINQLRQAQIENLNRPEKPTGGVTGQQMLTQVANAGKGLGYASPRLTEQELLSSPQYLAAVGDDPTGRKGMAFVAAYQESSAGQRMLIDNEKNKRLDSFEGVLRNEPMIRIRNDVDRGLDEVVQAVFIDGGFADIAMLKALAKLQDPGSVVRQEEFDTLERGLSLFDQMGIKLDNLFTGARLNQEGQRQVLELAFASYAARRNAIDGFVDRTIKGRSSGVPVMDLTGRADPFRLPSIELKIGEDRLSQLRDRYKGIRLERKEFDVWRDLSKTGSANSDQATTINNIQRARLLQNANVNAYGNTGTY
jgi:hypothetical protein